MCYDIMLYMKGQKNMNNHYYRLAIQPKNGIFAYHSIKVLNSNYLNFKHNNIHCLKIECLKCERTWSPTCELTDCKLSKPKDITFSDIEIEEINRIIKNYKRSVNSGPVVAAKRFTRI